MILFSNKNQQIKRFVALLVAVAFLSCDISWAYSSDTVQSPDKLAVEVVSQGVMMTDPGEILQNDVRSRAILYGVVLAVARFLMGTNASYSESTARKNLERVESFILGRAAESESALDSALSTLKLKKVAIDENNDVIIPFSPDAKDPDRESYFLVRPKGKATGKEPDGYVIPINDEHFTVTLLPEGYKRPGASVIAPKPSEPSIPAEPDPSTVNADNKEDDILVSAILSVFKALSVLAGLFCLAVVFSRGVIAAQPRPVWGPNRSDAVIDKSVSGEGQDLKPLDQPKGVSDRDLFGTVTPISDEELRATIARGTPPGWSDPYSGPINDPPYKQPLPWKADPSRKAVVWPSDVKEASTQNMEMKKGTEPERWHAKAPDWKPEYLGHLEPPPIPDDDTWASPGFFDAKIDQIPFPTSYRVENETAGEEKKNSTATAQAEDDPETLKGQIQISANKSLSPNDRAEAIDRLSDRFYSMADDGSIVETLESIAGDGTDDPVVRKAAAKSLWKIRNPIKSSLLWFVWGNPAMFVIELITFVAALVYVIGNFLGARNNKKARNQPVLDNARTADSGSSHKSAGLSRAADPTSSVDDADRPHSRYAARLKGYINNRISRTLEAGNRIIEATKLTPGGGDLRRDKNTLGATLVYLLGSLLDAVNDSYGASIPEEILDDLAIIERNIGQIDADTMITAAINLANGRDRIKEPFTIVIETSWIPGYNDRSGPQRSAITPLIRAIEDLPAMLRSLKLGDIKVLMRNSEDELKAWAEEGISDERDCSNIVVFGSKNAVSSIAERAGKMAESARPFLAGIDASSLTPDRKGSGEEFAVNLVRMLAVTLEIASGKKAPNNIPLGITVMNKRWIILIPPAEPVDILSLSDAYSALVKTLAAA